MTDTQIASTKHEGLISKLIATYRELNLSVRQLPEDRLTSGGPDGSIRSIIARMRLDEMLFAQALKQQVTGVVVGALNDEELEALRQSDDSTTMLISQFGSARETTLSLLRGLSEEEWTASTAEGKSILQHIEELIRSDEQQMQRLKQLIG